MENDPFAVINATFSTWKKLKDNKDFQNKVIDSLLTNEGIDHFADLLKVSAIARNFITKHEITCAEATIKDSVYEDAPILVENLAEILGYFKHEDEENQKEI